MWKSQVRLDEETIARIRQVASKRRWSLNQTIGELCRNQLDFLDRMESGQYRRASQPGQHPPGRQTLHDPGEYYLDTSDSQV